MYYLSLIFLEFINILRAKISKVCISSIYFSQNYFGLFAFVRALSLFDALAGYISLNFNVICFIYWLALRLFSDFILNIVTKRQSADSNSSDSSRMR